MVRTVIGFPINPVRSRLILAKDPDFLIEKQRPSFLTNPHRRMDRAPMNLINPAKTIGIPMVIEVPTRHK